MKKLTQADFLIKAVATHGMGRYDYSLAIYVNAIDKISIICPLHGVFMQPPGSHLAGHGCKKCACIGNGVKRKVDLAEFIAQASVVHNGKYDYSQSTFGHAKERVKIICPVHGLFEQLADNHLKGNGCNACRITSRKQTSYFLEKAALRHGDVYDYSKVDYKGAQSEVVIICRVHGEFKRKASEHLSGYGCRICGRVNRVAAAKDAQQLSWVERAAGKKCILYFIELTFQSEVFYKVGITFNSIEKRLLNKTGCYEYSLLASHASNYPAAILEWEQSILETFAHLRYEPKMSFIGETECFSSSEEILEIFPL